MNTLSDASTKRPKHEPSPAMPPDGRVKKENYPANIPESPKHAVF
jgi:hypothetical protein